MQISKTGELYRFIYDSTTPPEHLDSCKLLKDLTARLWNRLDFDNSAEDILIIIFFGSIVLFCAVIASVFLFFFGRKLTFNNFGDETEPIKTWPKIKGQNFKPASLGIPLLPFYVYFLTTTKFNFYWYGWIGFLISVSFEVCAVALAVFYVYRLCRWIAKQEFIKLLWHSVVAFFKGFCFKIEVVD